MPREDGAPTLEEFKAQAITDPHPAFTVEIDVAKFHDWAPLEGDDEPDDPNTPTIVLGDGRRAVRVTKDEATTTTLRFTPGGIDHEIAEREYARYFGQDGDKAAPAHWLSRRTFPQQVAVFIAENAMMREAPQEYWTDLRCAELPELEAFLKTMFGLPREYVEQGPVWTPVEPSAGEDVPPEEGPDK